METNINQLPEEKKQALLQLLQDTSWEEKLSKWTQRTNIFEILKISRTEIRHSNMLAWLLDPNENHGLGTDFLYAFISDLTKSHNYEFVEGNDIAPIIESDHALYLLSSDLTNTKVYREWNNIDIMMTLPGNYIIAIENKIDSTEHNANNTDKSQLEKYSGIINNYYSINNNEPYTHFKIYLTPFGDTPSENDWKVYTYGDVLNILIPFFDKHKDHLSIETKVLIENYINILNNEIMGNQDLKDLCNEIYKTHKTAIDLIISNIDSVTSIFIEICNKFYDKYTNDNNNFEKIDKKSTACIQFTTEIIRNIRKPIKEKKFELYYEILAKPSDNGVRASFKLIAHKGNKEIENILQEKFGELTFKTNWTWKDILSNYKTFDNIDEGEINNWLNERFDELNKKENQIQNTKVEDGNK